MVFKPDRLALHELIVRITADIVILEGKHEEDLGLNFRRVVHKIMDDYLTPHLEEIGKTFQTLYEQVRAMVNQELSASLFPDAEASIFHNSTMWSRPK